MNAVQYMVPKERIPAARENIEEAQKFADDDGWNEDQVIQEETIHDAETSYAEERGVHSAGAYRPLQMLNLDDGYNQNNWQEHWVIGNAGANNDEIASRPGTTLANEEVFPGGFAGRCGDGQTWTHGTNQEITNIPQWLCSGQLNWDLEYLVPDVNRGGEKTVGVFLKGSIFGSSSDSLEQAWETKKSENINLDAVEARCFAGLGSYSDVSDGQRFPDGGGWVTASSNQIDAGANELVGITGEIDLGTEGVYTCEWSFDVSGHPELDYIENAGNPVEIGAPGSDSEAGTIDEYSIGTDVCSGDTCGGDSVMIQSDPDSGGRMEELADEVSVASAN